MLQVSEAVWSSAARKLGRSEAETWDIEGFLAADTSLKSLCDPGCHGCSEKDLPLALVPKGAALGKGESPLLVSGAAAARCRAATNTSSGSHTPHGKAPPGFCGAGVWKLLVLTQFFPKVDLILLRKGAGKEEQL